MGKPQQVFFSGSREVPGHGLDLCISLPCQKPLAYYSFIQLSIGHREVKNCLGKRYRPYAKTFWNFFRNPPFLSALVFLNWDFFGHTKKSKACSDCDDGGNFDCA